jgi:predicted  nucleic acid-binding Zn-ribbon protein
MSNTITTQLERHNLEAHVDLCAERYRVLEKQINNVETRLDQIEEKVTGLREENIRAFAGMREDNLKQNQTTNRIMLGTAASVVAGILTVIVTIIMTT